MGILLKTSEVYPQTSSKRTGLFIPMECAPKRALNAVLPVRGFAPLAEIADLWYNEGGIEVLLGYVSSLEKLDGKGFEQE